LTVLLIIADHLGNFLFI